MRDLVAETKLHPSNLIQPFFVVESSGVKTPIESLPKQYHLSIDQLIEQARYAESLGIKAIALFPVVEDNLKDDTGSESWNPDNLICRAIKAIKEANINLAIIADVALDPYTNHGHDGILINGKIDNDETVELLVKQALCMAEAGADIIAPSDMMDGRIGAIRDAIDDNVIILSYAIKYASNFYGPFRDAIGSSTAKPINKSTYQMDFANSDEALREVALDIEEGADIVMVKPGMPYLDIISRVRDNFNIPIFAYQVSGEYKMLHDLAAGNEENFYQLMIESLVGLKRSGASSIISYAAMEIAGILC